jgi:tetratricopeptide (TPR) repeat protein
LGAKLARQEAAREEQVFWFTFDPLEKNTAEALLWSLAAFLDSQGHPHLWRYLKGEIDTQKPLETTVKLNLLLAGLASGDYVLCFDDFHKVKDAPDILHFFSLLRQRFIGQRQALPARFVLMGREVPPEMEYLVSGSLEGLTYEETKTFLEARGLAWPTPLLHRLWARTEGNPMLLELSSSALASMDGDQTAMEHFLEAMASRGDVCDYVMTEIYAALQTSERQVAGFLSIFPAPVERKVAEDTLLAEGVTGAASLITALANKSIVAETEDDRIHCHSLVREYCFRLLDRKDGERFHERAAQYYEQAGNYLAAAYHHIERGRPDQALDLLTVQAHAIINAGGAGSLLEQLTRFERQQISTEHWVALCLAQGDAHEIRGGYKEAVAAYEAALQEGTENEVRADLLTRIGLAYSQSGEYVRAIHYFMDSLTINQKLGDRAGVAQVYHAWGWACYRLGRLSKAQEHFALSRQTAQEIGDRLLLAKTDLGLGTVDWRKGRLEQARARFEESRHVFHAFGERRREAEAVGNLGLTLYQMGDSDRTLSYCRQAVKIQEEMGDVQGLCIAYNNLGNLHHLLGNYTQSLRYYEQLAQLAQDTGHKPMLSTAYSGLADAYLALEDPPQALEYAQKAWQIAQDTGLGFELGISCRVMGDAWLALGDPGQARAWFERSIPLLEEAQENEELAKAHHGLEQTVVEASIG